MLSKEIKKSILEKLLAQYKNYIDVFNEIKDLKFRLLKSQETEKEDLKNKISFLSTVLERLSDEMSFPTPSIWMMYKFYAYKNTDKDIHTGKDFIDHCTPEGYICTKRFEFLKDFLDVSTLLKETEELSNLFESPELAKLEEDPKFMEAWLSNEFKIINNKISKWK